MGRSCQRSVIFCNRDLSRAPEPEHLKAPARPFRNAIWGLLLGSSILLYRSAESCSWVMSRDFLHYDCFRFCKSAGFPPLFSFLCTREGGLAPLRTVVTIVRCYIREDNSNRTHRNNNAQKSRGSGSNNRLHPDCTWHTLRQVQNTGVGVNCYGTPDQQVSPFSLKPTQYLKFFICWCVCSKNSILCLAPPAMPDTSHALQRPKSCEASKKGKRKQEERETEIAKHPHSENPAQERSKETNRERSKL